MARKLKKSTSSGSTRERGSPAPKEIGGPGRTVPPDVEMIGSDTIGPADHRVEVAVAVADNSRSRIAGDEASKAALQANAAPDPLKELDGMASILCLALALALWGFFLPGIDPAGLTDYGLVSILPWQVWISLGFLAIGFSLTLTPKLSTGPLPFLHLIGLVIVLHATPAIVYETLRYSWAWKHLGIVDFIQRHGTVDRTAAYLSANHNWPGLFFATAWVADVIGLNSIDLSKIVRFVPTVLNLLYMSALVPIFRRFTDDTRIIVAAIWIFITGNWIGQDYFSPQGVAFLFYLIVIGICLGPLRTSPDWLYEARMRTGSYTTRLRTLVSLGPEMPLRPISDFTRAGFAAAVLVLILAITVTHQLTPIALIVALFSLAAIGRLSFAYCVFAIVAEVGWLLYFAAPFVMPILAEQFENFGQGIAVASERFVDTSVVSTGRYWVVISGRVLTVSVGLAAIVGGLCRLAVGYRDGAAIVLVGTAFPMFVSSYGGEILFRVYLFALPFLSFFAAAMFFPSRSHRRSWRWRGLFAAVGILAAVGFLFSNNGKDSYYRFTPDEVEAAHWLYANAPAGTLLIEGSRSYPSQFMNYENFTYIPISREEPTARKNILDNPDVIFARWLGDKKWKAGFVIITRSQKAYSDAEGVMPPGALGRIEQRLLASPRFIVVKATPNARIFALHPAVGSEGIWGEQRPEP